MTPKTKPPEELIRLQDLAPRAGGSLLTTRALIAEVGGEVLERWDGAAAVPVSIARKARELYDSRRAEAERLDTAYNAYLARWEGERKAAREAGREAQKEVEAEAQRQYFANPRANGGAPNMMPISVASWTRLPFMAPDVSQRCERAAVEAEHRWIRRNSRLERDEFERKHGGRSS